MRPLPLCRWLATSVIGAALVTGCNQAPRRTAPYASPRVTPMVMTPPRVSTSVMMTPAPAPQPVAAPPATLPPVAMEEEKKPVIEEKEKDKVVMEEKKEVLPANYALPLTGGKEEPVKRRTFNDITANPAYAHSADYGSLTGELQCVHIHAKECWCVRYASVDEEDRYGGKVTLIEAGPMTKFSDGQLVRIEGQLSNPESRDPSPTYRVHSIEPVNHQ